MCKKYLSAAIAAWVLFGVGSAAQAALPAGISGPWYNPEQDGHGLSVDLLSDGRAVVIWHVFDPEGKPLTLYIDGQVRGRRIDGVAYAPSGMRFGSFDPATLTLPEWGEVGLQFANCGEATLSWQAHDSRFGSGEIPMAKLALLDGVPCTLPPENPLPAGLYSGAFDAQGNGPATPGNAIVDGEGRLWGLQGGQIPGPGWVGVHIPRVIVAEPEQVDDGGVTARARDLPTLWATREGLLGQGRSVPANGTWTLGATPHIRIEPDSDLYRDYQAPVLGHEWTQGGANGASLNAPIDLQSLAGRYSVPVRQQFFELEANMEIEDDGSVCISLPLLYEGGCQLTGTLHTADGAEGLIDFELRSNENPALPAFRGRGWMQTTSSGSELFLVGDNGAVGFGLRAAPQF